MLTPCSGLDPMELIILANRLCLPRLVALTGKDSLCSVRKVAKRTTYQLECLVLTSVAQYGFNRASSALTNCLLSMTQQS